MATALKIKKELEEQIAGAVGYRKTTEEKAAFDMAEERKDFLVEYRKKTGIEQIWKHADEAYIPHKIKARASSKVLVSDDELGWRSAPIDLNVEDSWQEESVPPNPYIKIQTALGIIVDRNPKAIFEPSAKKYDANTMLMKNLYERSWETAMSKDAVLKPFVFNCAKYGTGVGRTFPLEISRDIRDLKTFVPEDPKKNVYEESTFTYYDDLFRESLSPWQVYFDDSMMYGNPFSSSDVLYYKDYDWLKLKSQFKHLKNFKYIKPEKKVIGDDNQIKTAEQGTEDKDGSKYQERVWFWENLEMDMFIVWTAGGVVLVNEPMPQSPKNKRLSVWSAPWTMRDDKSPYGIGIYEAMRNDHQLYTKVRNMTMDQLVASIYREFFYSGTDELDGDGEMKMRPGKGRQVSDAKNIKWNEVPGPNMDAWDAQDRIMARIDDVTGISKSLQGEITGSTAFEISQARESALKRMKTPLENITHALELDGYISCGIIEDLYSVPKIKLISEDRYIDFIELEEYETEEGGRLIEGEHYDTEYKEVPLYMERDEETKETRKSETRNFFKLKDDDFPWEGVIKIKGQSIIADSELLERTTTVEMANLVVPLFQMQREISEKPAREIIKAYNKDPEDWIPNAWMQPAPAPTGPQLFTDTNAEEEGAAPEVKQDEGLKEVVPNTDANSAASNLMNSIGNVGK